MPASRSRTERWRECLHQIRDRGGGLEIALTRPANAPIRGSDLCWRVRVIDVTDDELIVERPSSLAAPIPFEHGDRVTITMSIGQNRWMFTTHIVGLRLASSALVRGTPSLVLRMPEAVERCQRRAFMRISTTELSLPSVECWPLLDPTSVGPAELANRAAIEELSCQDITGIRPPEPSTLLPDVGPLFHARLMNLGGGGCGLLVPRSDAPAAEGSKLYWFRVDLTPEVPAPLAVTGRMVHIHLDSEQNVHAGIAFEFGFNPPHRSFVVDQLTRYVRKVQSAGAKLA